MSEVVKADKDCATCKGSGFETIICIAGDGHPERARERWERALDDAKVRPDMQDRQRIQRIEHRLETGQLDAGMPRLARIQQEPREDGRVIREGHCGRKACDYGHFFAVRCDCTRVP